MTGDSLVGVARLRATWAWRRRALAAHRWALAVIGAAGLVTMSVTPAHAAIPASERAVLVNLFNSAGGPSWTNSTGWNGAPGTECSWFGIGCDITGTHVTLIVLPNNHLVGTLPALGDLTGLQNFVANHNELTGSIPSVSGLASLMGFFVDHNQFTGGVPTVAGLTALKFFYVNDNNLTGTIPSLAGLTALEEFAVSFNQLTGPLPALAGSPLLREFFAGSNQLTGSLPSLAGLTALVEFNVGANQLTGPVPSLAGLTSLQSFFIFVNHLTGPMALPPSPSALLPGESNLCGNQLQSTGNAAADQAWDVASGMTPVFGEPGWLACQGVDFGNQVIFTTSAPKPITIAATVASGAISITSIMTSGDFAETHNCLQVLQPGESCTINITFTPLALGPRTGELTITGSTEGTGQISAPLPLRGNGVAAPPPGPTQPVPTLSGLGLLLLVGLLGGLGIARGRKHWRPLG